MSTVHFPHFDFRLVEKSIIACHDFTAPTMRIMLSTYAENLDAFTLSHHVISVVTHCTISLNSCIYLSFTVTHSLSDAGKRLYACSVARFDFIDLCSCHIFSFIFMYLLSCTLHAFLWSSFSI